MGLFLAVSGVIGASASDVQEALSKFARGRSGGFQLVKGTTDDPDIGVITREGVNTTVLHPNGFSDWDDSSQSISRELDKPVFSFHIHDGDLWMYVLFDEGEEVGHFNPLPDYWGELIPEEKENWKGDAELVAKLVPGISPDSINKYLVQWDPEQEEQVKAYPDDEFPVCDCWQMCDFMKKIGLEYPMGDDGAILGDTFRLSSPSTQPPSPETKKSPWWKFWDC